jgi:hypothetical protein
MVIRRRAELQMGRVAFARLASVHRSSLTSFEAGLSWPRSTTRARIEAALGWAPGSIVALRAGQEPTETPSETAPVSADLDNAKGLWELIQSGDLQGERRDEVIASFQRRQVELLPQRLDALSHQGLAAISQYIAILLAAEPSEGFRRAPEEQAWSRRRSQESITTGPAGVTAYDLVSPADTS